jgi:hypothetical protein
MITNDKLYYFLSFIFYNGILIQKSLKYDVLVLLGGV